MPALTRSVAARRLLSARMEPRGVALVAAPVGAVALLASAAIHVQQLVTIFHAVPGIGPLFAADAVTATAIAVVVVVTRARLAAAAGALVSAAALAGLAASSTVGVLGWKEAALRPPVVWAIVAEVAAFAVLAPLALPRPRRGTIPPRAVAAAGLAASAGLHLVAAGPEWDDARVVFWLFIALACGCLALVLRLAAGLDRWAWPAVLALAVLPAVGYVLSRAVALPGDRGDAGAWMTPLGLAALAVEVPLALLAVAALVRRRRPAVRAVRPLTAAEIRVSNRASRTTSEVQAARR